MQTESRPQAQNKSPAEWRARAVINLAAVRHNLRLARRCAPGSRVMAVVKANAYGHGLAAVSRGIADAVDAFAVATPEEGIACREAAPCVPVAVLSGLAGAHTLAVCGQYRLQPVVHAPAHLQWLEAYNGAPLNLWLKIDTGMHRLGIAAADAAAFAAKLRQNPRVKNVRLMSHLANADVPEDETTAAQLRRFKYCTDALELERSLANSAGVMAFPGAHFQWVRPGIMLYGASPFAGRFGADLGLRPAMQLEARLLAVKDLAAGQPVGYGGAFVAPSPMRIGIVGIGYADGYPRILSAAARAVVAGARVAVLGRVAMDMLTLDLTHCADAAIGDTAVLWGDELGVDEVAAWGGVLSYQLLCQVGARVKRVAA